MIAIRGATTITEDTSEQICAAVSGLLQEIARRNELVPEEILCILFSSTADIHSFYPAKAARIAGFSLPALYSSAEPEIEGALPLCIRVMLLAEKEGQAKHVYLNGAIALRKDLASRLVIALDGPAGSGKSTVAKQLAKIYRILYLDTGAMYRACALKAIRLGVDTKDEAGVAKFLPDLDLQICYRDGTQVTLLDGEDVSVAIRASEVARGASNVAAMPCVRLKMVEMQRAIAAKQSCVLDGRDIGSYVLPNAEHKFYVTASAEVRAKRRVADLEKMGESADFDAVLRQIVERDEQDKNREFAPLKRAEDAVLVDTSGQTLDETLAYIQSKIQEKI